MFSFQSVIIGNTMLRRKERAEKDRIAGERRRQVKEQPPDKMLAASPNNFEIPYGTVSSVELTRGLFQSQMKFHISDPATPRKTRTFNLSRRQIPEARKLLEQTLPEKIKEK